jgi:uncharacterized protein (DUF58 family)
MRKGALGTHQVRQLGKGREFEQLRDYLPGDSFGDIYWKGTAKRRYPVTMMHQIERTQEMHVVLDVSRRSARPLENLNSADRFEPKTQCEHYNAVRDALYTLESRVVSPDFNELFIQIGNRLRHRSLVIVLTDLGEPWLSESFAESVQHAARKHVVLVHVLGSKEFMPLFNRHDAIGHADQLYSRLAGHLLWSDLQATMRGLKQSGVHLTSSMQESLIADVVSEYLNVKKRQLL